MKLPLDSFQQIKNYIHAFQGILLFLAIVLTIATFGRDGQCGGSLCSLGWYMALCWLTVPILIYLVMVPMWSRARKFSNVYAFAVLDGLAILLWLTAWASTASYVASGAGKGKKKDASGCNNFKYGSPGRCKLSTGITILGVFMMLAFCATACVSFRAVMHYKRTGMMPNAPTGKNDFSVQTQDAFSSNMNNDEFDDVHGQSTDPRQSCSYCDGVQGVSRANGLQAVVRESRLPGGIVVVE